jgi:tetratricopeptide (TPR) repeat protein
MANKRFVAIAVLAAGLAGFAIGAGYTQESLWGQLFAQQQLAIQEGQWVEATVLAEGMQWIAQRSFSANHPHQEQALQAVAEARAALGNRAESIAAYQALVRAQETRLGTEHPDVAKTLLHLSTQQSLHAALPEAEAAYRRALVIKAAHRDLGDSLLVQALGNLNEGYRLRNQTASAETLLKDTLHTTRHVLGEQHPAVADYHQLLAEYYFNQDDLHAAEHNLKTAIAIREMRYGQGHITAAVTAVRLGQVLRERGDLLQAENYFEYGINTLSEQFSGGSLAGADISRVAISLEKRGNIYQELGLYLEAKLSYEQALDLYEKKLGGEHLRVAAVLEAYAQVLQALNMPQAAAAAAERARAIRSVH